ncbi:hypothetical protein F750_2347 [Streptomyces sp. PAMC 26508]|nr:hypothetical protein F750_2347 [Streptomyces sp. PAMC 26508]
MDRGGAERLAGGCTRDGRANAPDYRRAHPLDQIGGAHRGHHVRIRASHQPC